MMKDVEIMLKDVETHMMENVERCWDLYDERCWSNVERCWDLYDERCSKMFKESWKSIHIYVEIVERLEALVYRSFHLSTYFNIFTGWKTLKDKTI